MRTEEFSRAWSILLLFSLFAPLLILVTVTPYGTEAEVTNHVVISEFATRGPGGAYDEFLELYNPTDSDIDLEGWTVQYWNGSTWSTHITISPTDNKIIPARGFYLIAFENTLSGERFIPNADKYWMSSGWADGTPGSPRGLRIRNALGEVVDTVVYEGSGNTYNAQAEGYATAPSRGSANDAKSVERRPGYLDPYAGNGVDTDNNAADFIVRSVREPQSSSSPREPPIVFVSPQGKAGRPGAALEYRVIVTNVGASEESFTLSVDDDAGWSLSLSENLITVPAGENRVVTLTVNIPDNAPLGFVDNVTVTATSPSLSGTMTALAATSGVWIVASRSPLILNYAVAVVGAGENIYIANSDTAVPTTNLFMRFNTTTGEWSYLSTPPDAFKNGTCLAWDNGNYIYALLGGSYSDIGSNARHFFYRYDISADAWARLPDTPDTGGQGAGDAMTWVPGSALGVGDNFIYAIVGSHTHGSSFWRYSVLNNSWEQVVFHPGWADNTDDGCSLIWAGGEYLYALRGEYEETTACRDFARFRLIDNTWENLPPIPEYGGIGDGGSLLWIGGAYANYIYALGGGAAWEDLGDNFYAYKIAENLWTQLPDLPEPLGEQNGPRLGLAGGNIYAWRGCSGDPVLWVYNPVEVPNELRLEPTDDSYVHESRPTTNFGTYTTVFAGRYTYGGVPGAERGFLKFDLSVIPRGMSIVEAKLYLYCWQVDGGGANVQVQAVDDDSWSETTITWSNQPSPGAILDGPRLVDAVDWYSWDVTDFIADQYDGDGLVSLVLVDAWENIDPDHAARFNSKEYWNSDFHPYLRVTYSSLYGVSVGISPDRQSGLPGGTLSYTVTVANEGTLEDNFDLTVLDDAGWDLIIFPTPLTVPAGESRTATLSVTIPESAVPSMEDNVTVKATSRTNNAVTASATCVAHRSAPKLSFATLYKVKVDLDNTYVHEGSRLVVRFYTWENNYQAENIVWSGTTPAYLELHENVGNPAGTVENAQLVLTDELGNPILILAGLTVRRSALLGRTSGIKSAWPYADSATRSAFLGEVSGIKSKWPYAPS